MVVLKTLISILLFTSVLGAEEIGEKLNYTPLIHNDIGGNVEKANANFKKIGNFIIMGRGYNVTIPALATSVSITFDMVQSTNNYSCLVTPSWATRARVLQKTTTGFIIAIDSASTNEKVDWIIAR